MKILFVASEAAPFVRSGGLGDVAGALPKAFNKLGHDARVIIPYYKEEIKDSFKNGMKFVGSTFVDLSWRRQYVGVYEAVYDGVTYYFVDNEFYFKRRGLYGHFDDGERFAYFSKAVPEVLPLIGFFPDILHCNDWHTALTPVYLDVYYRFSDEYRSIKTVFTIHNIEFQGKYGTELLGDIMGLPEWAYSIVLNDGLVNYMKGGIEASAAVTTVSETYANEILDPFYSYGLEGILSERRYKLHGVLNGIDTAAYNPKTDPALFENYTLRTYAKKTLNKKGLCEMIDFAYDENRPLIAMVTRLTEQKGIDIMLDALARFMPDRIYALIIGSGSDMFNHRLEDFRAAHADSVRTVTGFSEETAHLAYAGGDILVMPSLFEPCGLSQLIAFAYGTIPVARATGGLADTVIDADGSPDGTGFLFTDYRIDELERALNRALAAKYDAERWSRIVRSAMKSDFSWNAAAAEYAELYKKVLKSE